MIKGIQSISTEYPELLSVSGFGSFFRSSTASDCDLLLVLSEGGRDLGLLHAELSRRFRWLGQELHVDFDLTVLTEQENAGRPLREHSSLVKLFP